MLLLLLNTITTRIYNKLSSSCTVFKVLLAKKSFSILIIIGLHGAFSLSLLEY